MSSTRNLQLGIGAVFFVLGGWALVLPRTVIDLTLLPQFRVGTPILPFTIQCFGAQAVLAGLFATFSRFVRMTFLVYGIALLPFFAFDVWFTFVDPVFTKLGLLDAVGNAVMLVLCVLGVRYGETS
ncbi:MAG TPA: hypothetical protein VGG10_09765 [Rhizomicrobium sp.]|jgi:hypothetical protein